MAKEIPLSQLGDNRDAFEAAVADQIAKLKAFSRTVGQPRPVAHPLVEAAIKRVSAPKADKKPDDFVADYVIIDDSPLAPPPLNLADRKQVLLQELRVAENEAKEKILPVLRRRLLILQFNAACAKKQEDRTSSENDLVLEYFTKQQEMTAVELISAQAEAALEDVTEDTIDKWQVPKFG